MADEHVICTELIELYREFPCLWDLSSEQYKDNNQKRLAWEILIKTWQKIDPTANDASVKKKIDNLKASYKRELKKVKDSKKSTSSAAELHKPKLWYFDLMTFLDKKDAQQRGTDSLSSDDNRAESHFGKKRRHSLLKRKKQRLIETTPQHSSQHNQTKTNSFGVYVGEQLDSLSTNQRQIAEKLISEVLFLGKTNNLNMSSKIEIHSNRHCSTFHSHHDHDDSSRFSPPQYITITASPEYSFSSPQYTKPSPHYNIPSQYTAESIDPLNQTEETQNQDGMLLKELLLKKSYKKE